MKKALLKLLRYLSVLVVVILVIIFTVGLFAIYVVFITIFDFFLCFTPRFKNNTYKELWLYDLSTFKERIMYFIMGEF